MPNLIGAIRLNLHHPGIRALPARREFMMHAKSMIARFAFASLLAAFATALCAADAGTLEKVTGKVTITGADNVVRTGGPRERVLAGETIATEAKSETMVKMADESTILLRPNTRFHETLDPHWLMPAERANSRLRELIAAGRLKLLYGSDATCRHWAENQYAGQVRYWSGISESTEYLGPASLRRTPGGKPARRVILNVGTVSGRKGTRA
jgi:hypothetical protein